MSENNYLKSRTYLITSYTNSGIKSLSHYVSKHKAELFYLMKTTNLITQSIFEISCLHLIDIVHTFVCVCVCVD